jgi:hypothetical protein
MTQSEYPDCGWLQEISTRAFISRPLTIFGKNKSRHEKMLLPDSGDFVRIYPSDLTGFLQPDG